MLRYITQKIGEPWTKRIRAYIPLIWVPNDTRILLKRASSSRGPAPRHKRPTKCSHLDTVYEWRARFVHRTAESPQWLNRRHCVSATTIHLMTSAMQGKNGRRTNESIIAPLGIKEGGGMHRAGKPIIVRIWKTCQESSIAPWSQTNYSPL